MAYCFLIFQTLFYQENNKLSRIMSYQKKKITSETGNRGTTAKAGLLFFEHSQLTEQKCFFKVMLHKCLFIIAINTVTELNWYYKSFFTGTIVPVKYIKGCSEDRILLGFGGSTLGWSSIEQLVGQSGAGGEEGEIWV